MSNIARMTGIPWHTERMHRDEDEERRHSHRCIYYDKNNDGYCSNRIGRCMGAAHCEYYLEKSRAKEEEVYYYTSSAK